MQKKQQVYYTVNFKSYAKVALRRYDNKKTCENQL